MPPPSRSSASQHERAQTSARHSQDERLSCGRGTSCRRPVKHHDNPQPLPRMTAAAPSGLQSTRRRSPLLSTRPAAQQRMHSSKHAEGLPPRGGGRELSGVSRGPQADPEVRAHNAAGGELESRRGRRRCQSAGRGPGPHGCVCGRRGLRASRRMPSVFAFRRRQTRQVGLWKATLPPLKGCQGAGLGGERRGLPPGSD